MPDLDARVARTAKGLDHINRLRLPGFGVVWLRLVTQGGAKSNAYMPEGYNTLTDGSDYFCFAPGVPDDRVRITYKIADSRGQITKGRLELFRKGEEKPFWSVALQAESLTDGEHKSILWDGNLEWAALAKKWDASVLTTPDDFPKTGGKYIPLGSPYKLKLTVEGDTPGMPGTAWTYFHVLLAGLDLKLGPRKVLHLERDQKLWDSLQLDDSLKGNLPASGEEKNIYLLSNVFKDAPGDMGTTIISYNEYQKAWGDGGKGKDTSGTLVDPISDKGPNIPVFAEIKIKSSKGEKVDAPLALGAAKFLWEWENVAEDMSKQLPWDKEFIERAHNHRPYTTSPRGSNCHKDFGGKRGDDAAPVFPEQKPDLTKPIPDGTFPFPVEKCSKRSWAVFSHAATSGDYANKTGVMFQPSRMAGDGYRLRVYLAEKSDEVQLDVALPVVPPPAPPFDPTVVPPMAFPAAPAPVPPFPPTVAPMRVETGVLRVWRRIQVCKYIRKSSAIEDWFGVKANLEAVQKYYATAFVDLQMSTPPNLTLSGAAADYDKAVKDAIAAMPDGTIMNYDVTKYYVDSGANQYSSSDAMITCRDLSGVKKAISDDFYPAELTAVQTAFPAKTPAEQQTMARQRADNKATNLMTTKGVDTVDGYASTIESPLADLDGPILGKLRLFDGVDEGLVVVQFIHVHSVALAGLNGEAVDVDGHTRNRAAFVFWNARRDTFGHEIGHHLFIRHAQGGNGTEPIPGPHDDSLGSRGKLAEFASLPTEGDTPGANVDNCLMSYERPRASFCGYCQLRLRGWNGDIISPTSSKNQDW